MLAQHSASTILNPAGYFSDAKWPQLKPLLVDGKGSKKYRLARHLGDGGFARVFLGQDENEKAIAAKIMDKKKLLASPRNQEKLLSEIKIQRGMKHAHIVRLDSYFEDKDFVYLILELCEHQSMMELLKKRRCLSEPEIRYYMLQIQEAVQYMHENMVIHRDLKLGNVFIDADMQVKIGDFGLAAKLLDEDDRKRSFCGTPNYIAPELLFDKESGYSYQVDVWALGIIMYTLLFGTPPFQIRGGRDPNLIYQKIQEMDYSFPPQHSASAEAKDLITRLLSKMPNDRPHISEIKHHPFFHTGHVPATLPQKALRSEPEFPAWQPPPTPAAKPSDAFQMNALAHAIQEMEPNKHVLVPLGYAKGGRSAAPSPPSLDPVVSDRSSPAPPAPVGRRQDILVQLKENLAQFFAALHSGRAPSSRLAPASGRAASPDAFIAKWIDMTSKYGLGYQLTNGTIGVYFNDCTTLLLSDNEQALDYLYYQSGHKGQITKDRYKRNDYPPELRKKVTILFNFKSFMEQQLSNTFPMSATPESSRPASGATTPVAGPEVLARDSLFLTKFLRTKHAAFFRISNGVVQVNFFDHTKVILAEGGCVITFVNYKGGVTTHTLAALPASLGCKDVIKRLEYIKDVIEELLVRKPPAAKSRANPAPRNETLESSHSSGSNVHGEGS